ncbi:hypothetical protein Q8W30_14740 [Neptunomonas phycophila]|uniref:CdiI immunity protein domain-containing protein n=1 Tax=Neptunomonas phycophila TaxID=1572645 RepID=A0ABT9EXS3_9GAMM|nr:hypothetical protein [Neptunomonas phycophila]MDP2523830.1 hypothetical protein [Neptunomonas phycophila]
MVEVWAAYIPRFFAEHTDFYEGVQFALEGLNSSEKDELLTFIRSTLNQNQTNQYLIDLWFKSGASDALVSDQMKVVYEVLLQAIETSIEE